MYKFYYILIIKIILKLLCIHLKYYLPSFDNIIKSLNRKLLFY